MRDVRLVQDCLHRILATAAAGRQQRGRPEERAVLEVVQQEARHLEEGHVLEPVAHLEGLGDALQVMEQDPAEAAGHEREEAARVGLLAGPGEVEELVGVEVGQPGAALLGRAVDRAVHRHPLPAHLIAGAVPLQLVTEAALGGHVRAVGEALAPELLLPEGLRAALRPDLRPLASHGGQGIRGVVEEEEEHLEAEGDVPGEPRLEVALVDALDHGDERQADAFDALLLETIVTLCVAERLPTADVASGLLGLRPPARARHARPDRQAPRLCRPLLPVRRRAGRKAGSRLGLGELRRGDARGCLGDPIQVEGGEGQHCAVQPHPGPPPGSARRALLPPAAVQAAAGPPKSPEAAAEPAVAVGPAEGHHHAILLPAGQDVEEPVASALAAGVVEADGAPDVHGEVHHAARLEVVAGAGPLAVQAGHVRLPSPALVDPVKLVEVDHRRFRSTA
mmetsp:Transcript_967/g.3211  ORF Transcript_967/g.3211 Transcript_967/m.3211 type:complete len:451 (+) Transcript_967:988-2340(+)